MIKMAGNIGKEDSRIAKTERALNVAILSLLQTRNFRKITVSDLCAEALISRATFYAHFIDKYDLLKNCLLQLNPKEMYCDDSYESLEKVINQLVRENELVIKNIIDDADAETLNILFDTILAALDFAPEGNGSKKHSAKDVVFSNICAGGIIYYLLWQVKNKYPADVQPMNTYLYDLINKLRKWSAEPSPPQ